MVRFLHTADLQLGKPYAWLEGDAAAALRRARMDALARVLKVARDHDASFVVIAGDLFEANTVSSDIVAQTCDIVKGASIDVYVIPGNHDHGGADSVFSQTTMETHRPPNLHLLLEPEPVVAAEGAALLLPAPLLRRHEHRDVTTHITKELGRDLAPDAVRIGIAHGGVADFGESGDAKNEIDPELAAKAELDYLALGDWHGLKEVGPRAWYSGTPEPDRFKANDPGKVLVVKVDAPGKEPELTPVETLQYRWVMQARTFRGVEDIEAFRSFAEALEEPRHTLLRLEYEGALDMGEATKLREVLQNTRDRLHHLRERGTGVVAMPSPEELAALELDGYLGAAVDGLRSAAELPEGAAPTDESRTAAGALDLLYRLYQQGVE